MATELTVPRSRIRFHVDKIEKAQQSVRESFFALVSAVSEARSELGVEVLNKDLASQLSFSPSYLTKLLQIADCKPLLRRQKTLPPTLTTLYDLAQLHKNLVKGYGESGGEERFQKILGKVNADTEAKDIHPFVQKAKEKVASKRRREREKDILTLSDTSVANVATRSRLRDWKSILDSREVYRTFFLDPSEKTLGWIAKSGVLPSDVAEKYPIDTLRSPSQSETVQCFVYCGGQYIDAALKLLDAAGFAYRDIFVPSSGVDGFEYLKDQRVLVRGERGRATSFVLSKHMEATDASALAIAQSLGGEPYLYVFAEEAVSGWTCTNPDQS